MSGVEKASALDFLGLFAGHSDQMPAEARTPQGWREAAEDLAAFMDAHESCLPNTEAFMMMLRIGGLLLAVSEAPTNGEAAA
jgi:hypothetical protein